MLGLLNKNEHAFNTPLRVVQIAELDSKCLIQKLEFCFLKVEFVIGHFCLPSHPLKRRSIAEQHSYWK